MTYLGTSATLNGKRVDLTYWPVGLGMRSFSDHIEVCQAGGFNRLAISPNRAKAMLLAGDRPADIVDRALEKGVKIGPLDGIATWVKNWRNQHSAPALREMMDAAFDIELAEALEIGASLGSHDVVAVGYFDEGGVPIDEIIEGYGRFCDAAQSYCITVNLEFIPFWGIPDLPMATEIVRTAERANSGILIDTWHLQKGSRDFEADLALLETLPGNWFKHVQLADGDIISRAESLAGDVMFRKLPGRGELAVVRILSLVASIGDVKSVGPEIVNAEQIEMANSAIGVESGRTTRETIEAADAKAFDRLSKLGKQNG